MGVWQKITDLFRKSETKSPDTTLAGYAINRPSAMWPWDFIGQLQDIKSKIVEIEDLDANDGQIKELHLKMARMATRGGIRFIAKTQNDKMAEIANAWIKRVKLDERETRKQHATRLLKHGNLVIQNVLSANRVEQLIVMPTETMRPIKDDQDQFISPIKAYVQFEYYGTNETASFAQWQISWVALDKDAGKLYGRPLIDSERKRAKQVRMTDDDLVIRRRVRATLRLLHVLEGASEDDIKAYKNRNKDSRENPLKVDSDLYSNKASSVQPIQGDANLDQIKDVQLLNQKLYAGAGTHAHHFGIMSENLNRDIYEDTLADLFERIEEIQELLCDAWEKSLRLEFLLNGINADAYDWDLELVGRKVETPNQQIDRALKEQALGLPLEFIVTRTLGYPWETIAALRDKEIAESDPYGARVNAETGKPPLTIVQGNQRGKESKVYVSDG